MRSRCVLGQAKTRRRKRCKGKVQPDLPDGRERWAARHDLARGLKLSDRVWYNAIYYITYSHNPKGANYQCKLSLHSFPNGYISGRMNKGRWNALICSLAQPWCGGGLELVRSSRSNVCFDQENGGPHVKVSPLVLVYNTKSQWRRNKINIEFCSKGDKDHVQLIVVILSCLYLCFSFGYIKVVPKSAVAQSCV